ncbi:N-acetyldiaminopimelate deacetylase [Alkalihalobacillus sp. MEB203]|uniref:N-acetyldiaminopimelate deacetylase n=1 Tax=Alkalihalobacterium chitinilyticum TaxID=2980103 RepID=A0ABT5VCY6_9BACI|nr:N-acetyldiaminopimelate deacetylase [Alkalihalobacterium chitinilyticum]MDE5413160.1 N-acetyldiaminopimelate deacetylase [Alkalihalobacterium chitinilyticum]
MDGSKLVEVRRALHQIPELGFEEVKTQAFLLEYINQLPQAYLEIKTWKTGIVVKVQGSDPSKMIGYRADIDGLPMDEETSYSFRSTHPGKMHACGHDLHMTIALGVLTHFSKAQPKDNLLFIFQPAEEGPGGAQPMLASDILKEWRPDQIVALHIAPEYPVGTIATREGLLFANTSELFIDLKGQGGHAAYPHTTRDMIVAGAYLVTQLQSIVSRNVDPLDSAVVTIGKITGGTKQNIIAEKARIEGTIRTLSIESMQKVKQRIEALVKGIEAGFECSATIDYGANYCQVFNDEKLTREFINFTRDHSSIELIECTEAMTGEDFGYFLEEIPGFMFWLGVNSPYGLHDNRLEPSEQAIEVAVTHLINYLHYKSEN